MANTARQRLNGLEGEIRVDKPKTMEITLLPGKPVRCLPRFPISTELKELHNADSVRGCEPAYLCYMSVGIGDTCDPLCIGALKWSSALWALHPSSIPAYLSIRRLPAAQFVEDESSEF